MEREVVENRSFRIGMFEADAIKIDFAFFDFEFLCARSINHIVLGIENDGHFVCIAKHTVDVFENVVYVPELIHDTH